MIHFEDALLREAARIHSIRTELRGPAFFKKLQAALFPDTPLPCGLSGFKREHLGIDKETTQCLVQYAGMEPKGLKYTRYVVGAVFVYILMGLFRLVKDKNVIRLIRNCNMAIEKKLVDGNTENVEGGGFAHWIKNWLINLKEKLIDGKTENGEGGGFPQSENYVETMIDATLTQTREYEKNRRDKELKEKSDEITSIRIALAEKDKVISELKETNEKKLEALLKRHESELRRKEAQVRETKDELGYREENIRSLEEENSEKETKISNLRDRLAIVNELLLREGDSRQKSLQSVVDCIHLYLTLDEQNQKGCLRHQTEADRGLARHFKNMIQSQLQATESYLDCIEQKEDSNEESLYQLRKCMETATKFKNTLEVHLKAKDDAVIFVGKKFSMQSVLSASQEKIIKMTPVTWDFCRRATGLIEHSKQDFEMKNNVSVLFNVLNNQEAEIILRGRPVDLDRVEKNLFAIPPNKQKSKCCRKIGRAICKMPCMGMGKKESTKKPSFETVVVSPQERMLKLGPMSFAVFWRIFKGVSKVNFERENKVKLFISHPPTPKFYNLVNKEKVDIILVGEPKNLRKATKEFESLYSILHEQENILSWGGPSMGIFRLIFPATFLP